VRRVAFVAAWVAASVLSTSGARADDPPPSTAPAEEPLAPVAMETTSIPKASPRLVWDERWPRFRVIEYGATTTAYEMLGFIELKLKLPPVPRWKGGILFDNAVRSVFLLHSRNGRLAAGNVADALAIGDEIEPVLASTVPPLVDGMNVDVAWQMVTIDLEAQAFTGLSQRSLMYLAERARPYYDACKKDKKYAECGGVSASFPSGHSSSAFAGAGTSCAHHLHLPLYGGGAPDVIVCVLALMAATGAAASRLMADDHWATDVILGSSLGLFYGYGFPTILHYHALLPSLEKKHIRAFLVPDVHDDKYGAKIVGQF
jgi:membrane-associated phospholipid phosphatase